MIKTKCEVIDIRKETPDIIIFSLRPEEKIDFKPGQFIMVIFDDCKRAYSIASSPNQEIIELCIKIIPNGKASSHFSNLKVGSKIEIQGPYGKFIFQDDEKPVFIAIGSGISAIMSMLRSMKTNNATLFYGFRTENDFAYRNVILEFIKQGRIKPYLCLSKATKPDFEFFNGRVTEILPSVDIDLDSTIYICGLPKAVNDIESILLKKGLKPKNIKKEIY